ncbi:MerR family transcriptional regulator [Alginatibacterium sediminis]|uniref:MerR family transcriptional regulator n=1 Tax=Alginatibacterium sediminis TaxID=2164068 RepID=A0A420EBT1_9ALTE|nr:MerR family transcriptional regulator [Alginatibacterium sediminis]RKF18131.1 MerR family transcriptional regulator [Alginatibacterium sediminis]
MNMSEFSSLVKISSHTLRYYEKIGLLKNVQRNSSRHREYSNKDLNWISFVKRLKDTGMPLSEIKSYADLRELGPSTLQQRQELLELHQRQLEAHIKLQQLYLLQLETKINLYKQGKVS